MKRIFTLISLFAFIFITSCTTDSHSDNHHEGGSSEIMENDSHMHKDEMMHGEHMDDEHHMDSTHMDQGDHIEGEDDHH